MKWVLFQIRKELVMKFFRTIQKKHCKRTKDMARKATAFLCILTMFGSSSILAEASRLTYAIGDNYSSDLSTYESNNSEFYFEKKGAISDKGTLKSLYQTTYTKASNKAYSFNTGTKTQTVKLVDDLLDTNFSLASQYTFYVKNKGYTGTTTVDTSVYPFAKSYYKWQDNMGKTDAESWQDSDGHVLAKGYKLTKDNIGSLASNSPYCVYKNAGLYTDANGVSHQVDIKVELTKATIASAEASGAGFFAFRKDKPGIYTWQVAWCTVNYKFYEGGTAGTANEKALKISGHLTFKDIDDEQGVAFPDSGFDNFYVYADEATKEQASDLSDFFKELSEAAAGESVLYVHPGFEGVGKLMPVVYDSGDNKYLYVYDMSGEGSAESADDHFTTWVTATFSNQSELTLRFTNDHYSNSYAKSSSDKNIYTTTAWWWAEATKLTASIPQAPHKTINKSVIKNKEEFAYTLSHYVPIEDVTTGTNYKTYTFTDQIPGYFTVKSVAITNEEGADASGYFTVDNTSNKLTISATSAALKKEDFYGHNYAFKVTCQLSDGQLVPAITASTGNGIPNTGYLTISNKKGTILDNKATETVYIKVTGEANITVVKQGEFKNEPLHSATFKIQQWNGTAYEDMNYTITTDNTGKATTKALAITATNQGKFRVVEVTPPKGYGLLEVNAWDVSLADGNSKTLGPLVNRNGGIPEAYLQIKKVDKDTGNMVSGAEFTIYEWDSTKGAYKTEPYDVMKEYPEIDPGLYSNKNQLTYVQGYNDGKFKVVETKAPDGYYYNADSPWEQEFNVMDLPEDAVLEYTCENEMIKGIINIEKTDAESGELLADAAFEIVAAEEIKAADGTLLVKQGDVVDTLITDENGKASSGELFLGKYEVREVTAPAEYFLTEEVYLAELAYPESGQHPKNVTLTVKATDRKMNPQAVIAKLAPKTTGVELKNGRYQGEKKTGKYSPDEVIEYAITVTNTGDVPLKQVKVSDTMSSGLKAAISGEAGFVLQEGETVTSTKGNTVTVLSNKKYQALSISGNSLSTVRNSVSGNEIVENENEDASLTLDTLVAGDSVTVTYRVTVGAGTAMAYREENQAAVTALYYNNREDKELPETEEMKDTDAIHVPGIPKIDVAKIADKTTGLTLVDGQYEGTRIIGTYKPGETITYTITATNSGTTDLYKLTVTDNPSDALKEAIENGTLKFVLPENKTLTSKNGRETKITLDETGNTASFDYLAAGDSIEFTLTAVVRSDITDKNQLANNVYVNAYYFDGEDYVPVDPPGDDEEVSVPGTPDVAVAKLANKTTGVTMENGRYSGTKVAGDYNLGEEVDFLITVTNQGTAKLTKLVIKDTVSEDLKNSLEDGHGFVLEEGIKTKNGNAITLTLSEDKTVVYADALETGDSFELHYKGKVKTSVGNITGAKNEVTVTAKYHDGNNPEAEVTDTDGDAIDSDTINIPGYGKLTVKKTAQKTAKVGETIDYTFAKIENNSSAEVKNFTLTDTLPKKTALVTYTTGTYNKKVTYKLYYKTNLSSDFKLWKKNISSKSNKTFHVSDLKLKDNEHVTAFAVEFGTVPKGFKVKKAPSYQVVTSNKLTEDTKLTNKVTLTGDYFGKKLTADSDASTVMEEADKPETTTPTPEYNIPKTGDTANRAVWIVAIMAAVIVLTAVFLPKKVWNKILKKQTSGKVKK
ncbi:MAG: DUF11 domain-containing protein [Lachnospiraceae bacterium]|nr:DUF11 domain-containing protein [Lachnospiraceae bacterium]